MRPSALVEINRGAAFNDDASEEVPAQIEAAENGNTGSTPDAQVGEGGAAAAFNHDSEAGPDVENDPVSPLQLFGHAGENAVP